MSSMTKIVEITSRLDHLEAAAEWISRETVHTDNSVSQTSTLITVLAEDVRTKLIDLVKQLEEIRELGGLN